MPAFPSASQAESAEGLVEVTVRVRPKKDEEEGVVEVDTDKGEVRVNENKLWYPYLVLTFGESCFL